MSNPPPQSSVGLSKTGKTLLGNDPVKDRKEGNAKAQSEAVSQMSIDGYRNALVTALAAIINTPMEEAAKESPIILWLSTLEEGATKYETGLPYTKKISKTMYMRVQEQFRQLLGASEAKYQPQYEQHITRATKLMRESVEKRLGKDAAKVVVDKETLMMVNDFKTRLCVTATTPWVTGFHKMKIPAAAAVDRLISLFIYSVDVKYCDCGGIEECKTKEAAKQADDAKKHRSKVDPPPSFAVQGWQSQVWAVANWAIRVQTDTSRLKPDEIELLKSTLEFFAPYLSMVDMGLDALPTIGMRVVFRGVDVRLAHTFTIGDDFAMEPHTSTSLVGEESLNYLNPDKPGTFFIFKLFSASFIDFVSAYPEQVEGLLTMHSEFTVVSKMSRTVLRMLGCRFDIVNLTEKGSKASTEEMVEFLLRVAQQTQFIYREYLNRMIPTRVSEGQNKTSVLMIEHLEATMKDETMQHVVLHGEAGSGKTSATLSLYSKLVQQPGCFAVLIPLPSVNGFGEEGDIDREMCEVLDTTMEVLEVMVKARKMFVILDSLDEVTNLTPEMVKTGVLSRNKFLQKTRVILSCRSEMFATMNLSEPAHVLCGADSKEVGSISVWNVCPFNDQDAAAMITQKAAQLKDVDERDLKEHADRTPSSLRRNPLMLQMILSIPIGRIKDGATKNSIYQEYILAALRHCYTDDSEKVKTMNTKLQEFALKEMLLKQRWQLTVGTTLKSLGCDSDELEKLPFRVDDANDNESQLGFLHRSQAEYLAAMELAKHPKEIKAVTAELPATVKLGTLEFLMDMDDNEAARDRAIDELLTSCGEGVMVIDKLETIIATTEAEFGKHHITLAVTLLNLGVAYSKKGDYVKSLELAERALQLKESHYGNDHIELAVPLINIGRAYSNKGDNDKYLELTERALQLEESHYGNDHIKLAVTLSNLGDAYSNKGDTDKRLELTERALQVEESHYGKDHIELAVTLGNLAAAYSKKGDYVKSLELAERALQLQESHYGKDHITLAVPLINLGQAYNKKGDTDKYLELTERALQLEETHYGKDHITLAVTLSHVGMAYYKKGDNDKFVELSERSLQLKESHYGKDHISLAATLSNLGQAYSNKGDKDKYLELTERALQLEERHYGKDHIELGVTLINLAQAYKNKGDNRKYLELTERASQLK